MTGAERSRRHRARRAAGVVVLTLEVDAEIAADLESAGWIEPGRTEDREAITSAIADLLCWWRRRFGRDADLSIERVTRHAMGGPSRAIDDDDAA